MKILEILGKNRIRISVALIIILIVFIYFHSFKPEYKEVYDKTSTFKDNVPNIIVLKSEIYDGFFTPECLEEFDIAYDDLDLIHHTYIITFGYVLKGVSYSLSDCRTHKAFIIPSNYIAKVKLSTKRDNVIHIYELDKIDIDTRFPDGRTDVEFVE